MKLTHRRVITPTNGKFQPVSGKIRYNGKWSAVDRNCVLYIISLMETGESIDMLAKIYDVQLNSLTGWYAKYMGKRYRAPILKKRGPKVEGRQ